MVFNGEIYNYMEVKRQLPDYSFRTSSDTEAVLAAYMRWGSEALHKLAGMFALAIWDSVEEELFVARDRMGVKPLYYFLGTDYFVFASEIRAILATGVVPRKLQPDAVFDYLKHQSSITPLTLVKDLMQLPAGHMGIWTRKKGFTKRCYWDITRHRDEPVPSKQDAMAGVRERMFRSVERRLVADVPVGAFLSGGIDSSAVVAIMAQVSAKKPVAFTVSFAEKAYDESAYAELVAEKYKVDHTKILLRPADFLRQLPEALNALDTPSGDGLNTYVVSQAIRKNGITVSLSGMGGDELFGGYPLFEQYRKLKAAGGWYTLAWPIRRLVAGMMQGSDQKAARIRQLLSLPKLTVGQIYPLLRQIQSPEAIRQMYPAADAGFQGSLEHTLATMEGAIHKFAPYSQVSIADYLGYTQHVLLKDTDQMSMAHSLEVREPFFDHELVEFVLALPDAYKRGSYPKQLLVDALKPLIPDEVVHRKKMGFVLPYDNWLRRELRTFCSGKIKNLADREGFNGAYLMDFWENFLSGKGRIRWADVWTMVVLENWLEENKIQ
jgi:asparagine synthase (glutamine-hydrolysing)